MDAVRLALERDPNIALAEARLEGARGSLIRAAGDFDAVLDSAVTGSDVRAPLSETASSRREALTSTAGVSKLLRSGLSLEPSVELERGRDPTTAAPPVNTGTLRFTLRQPLLRGRGRAATAAGEMAAARELAAAELDLRHTVAQRVRAVAAAYWRQTAAARDLEIFLTTEASSRQLLANTRRLVEADVTPAADLVLLEADLAAKESARIGGEGDLYAAARELEREIGLGPRATAGPRPGALPPLGDAFPEVEASALPPAPEPLVIMALERRHDLAAARRRRAGAAILLAAAEKDLLPRLDLVFTPAYSGLVEGGGGEDFLSALAQNVPGASATLTFSLSLPLANRRAEGALVESRAAWRQSDLAVELAEVAVAADVAVAFDAVYGAAPQLERAAAAVELFEQAVINEEKKLRAGSSTLIDVLSQRDRLTAARQREVSARLTLALAVLDLRFTTGTLLAPGEGEGAAPGGVTLGREHLTTLPPWGEPPRR